MRSLAHIIRANAELKELRDKGIVAPPPAGLPEPASIFDQAEDALNEAMASGYAD
jgi:hypothetical protein